MSLTSRIAEAMKEDEWKVTDYWYVFDSKANQWRPVQAVSAAFFVMMGKKIMLGKPSEDVNV